MNYKLQLQTEKSKKKMSKHAMEASFGNIEQNLIELIADFLDSEAVVLDEAIGLISDPEKSENTELHIRMAMAAMNEYKKTVTYDGSEKNQKITPLFYEGTSLVKIKKNKSEEELRDGFAKSALIGLMGNYLEFNETDMAKMCYGYADELMKARKL